MFTVLTRDLTDLLRNPRAFIGGLAGSTMCMAGVLGLTMFPPADRDGGDEQDDELQMEFLAGALVRRGEKPPEDPIPVKVIVDATHAVDVPPDTTVTTNQDAPPAPPKPPPTPDKPKVPSKDPPDPNKPGKPGTHTTPGNNTHNDHPTADQLPGDPFGSPDGWSDMAKDGDPWATAVLAALNNLTVGSYAGLGQDVTYKFQIIVCADGTIDDVRTKQSSGKSDFDGQMRNAIERIKLPKAPADIAKQLAGGCKKIPYIFTWAGKGKVQ
jgi:hypothetical protein